MSFSTTKLDHRHGCCSPKDISYKDVRALDCKRQTEIASVEDDEEVQMDDVSASTSATTIAAILPAPNVEGNAISHRLSKTHACANPGSYLTDVSKYLRFHMPFSPSAFVIPSPSSHSQLVLSALFLMNRSYRFVLGAFRNAS